MLPNLLAAITRTKRYKPDIVWSANSWTHNIFRLFELVFWRKVGIRKEMASWIDASGVHYRAFSFEAKCALFEQQIRALIPKLSFEQVPLPVAVTPYGVPFLGFSYLLAIALDVASSGTNTGTSPLTWSHINKSNQ